MEKEEEKKEEKEREEEGDEIMHTKMATIAAPITISWEPAMY